MEQTEEEQYESIKEEKKKATCRRQICVIVIASIVVIAGSGIGVWRIFVRNDNDRPNIVPPKQDYYVRRGDDVSMHYTINLVNPREVRLLKETPYGNNTLFSVNLTNDALQTMLNDQVNVSIYVKDAEIEVKVSISSTKCLHDGTYYIMIISDTNGFKHSRSNLRVLSECPCRLEFNISSVQDIKCSFPDADNTSIVITKASGDNSMILANYSDITRPSNIPNTKGFSASWLPNGTLVVKIRLGQINCTHEGYYNVNLTMNDITRMHDIFVHVIDHPEEPRLSVLEGGITKDKNWGQMLCSAITGCTKTQFILEYQPNEDQWIKWPSSYTTKFEPNRWYSESFINITEFEINTIDKKKFRCSYKANEKTFTSDTLCVRVIPEGFCMNNTGCNYEHPYFCSKFITCTSVAEERSCPLGLHFLYKGNCGGNCKYRTDQYQLDCNGYCAWPQNVNCTKPTNYCD